jgi:hypothetical protein
LNTQEILDQLKFNTGTFPRQALQEAMARPHDMIPELLNVLRYNIENLEEIAENLTSIGYIQNIFALYLLAQFREKQAYPLLVKFLSLPEELLFDVTGDVITEDMGRILASVSCGDVQLLPSLIENSDINEYIRSVTLSSYLVLLCSGEISRDEVLKYLQYLFREGLERKHSHIWNELVVCSTKIYPEELYQDIKKAYEDGLIDPFSVGIQDVDDALQKGKERTLLLLKKDHHCSLIEDTIQELQWWACFEPKKKLKQNSNRLVEESQKFPKIGRNQPCPCGSGKKYKKCCLLDLNER